jgi:hypothetical protein
VKQEPKAGLAHLIDEVTGLQADVAEIKQQGRLTLELVRVIAELVIPKGDRSESSLDKLLATMIVQLRELTLIVRETQAVVSRLEQRSGPNGIATPIDRGGPPGEARR